MRHELTLKPDHPSGAGHRLAGAHRTKSAENPSFEVPARQIIPTGLVAHFFGCRGAEAVGRACAVGKRVFVDSPTSITVPMHRDGRPSPQFNPWLTETKGLHLAALRLTDDLRRFQVSGWRGNAHRRSLDVVSSLRPAFDTEPKADLHVAQLRALD